MSKKQHFRIFLVSYCFFGFCCLHFKALLKNNQSIQSYPTIKHSRIVCSRQSPIDIVMQAKRERTKESSWFAAITIPFHIYASVAILLAQWKSTGDVFFVS